MDKRLSVYLDLMRFSMAAVVMLSHYSSGRLSGGLFWRFGGYGSQAVMAFFVLSGFVIAYTAESKERDICGFMKSRFARLYSVVIPALLLTLIVDAIGRYAAPGLYTAAWGYSTEEPARRLFMSLAFLNHIWVLDVKAFSDLPFWSLGYEFWYYVMFAMIFFLSGRRRILAVSATALLVGPGILMLLPVWWFGVWTYRWCRTHRVSSGTGWCLFFGSIVGFVAIQYSGLHPMLRSYFQSHVYTVVNRAFFPPTRNILYDYMVGFLVAANIIGFSVVQYAFTAPLMRLKRPIVYMAGLTFSLYLFHMPLLQVFAALYGGDSNAWGRRIFIIVATLLCVWLLGSVTERKKHIARRIIDALGARVVTTYSYLLPREEKVNKEEARGQFMN